MKKARRKDGATKVASIHTRARPRSLAQYLAVMSRAIFQAGLSWALIDRQWDALCVAFDGFDPVKVARYGARDFKRLSDTPGIVHSRRKVDAIVANARSMLALEQERGGFARYLRSFSDYASASADIRARFAHVGEISAYYFLFRVGEPVPPFAGWSTTVKGEHPRIREMVGG
ncbi:MAG: DNA-3-methyladenine glycosylase I [Candidatus Eremiobacteraeota bacterium]|nr:DNA-3-methyladenine glycosylase I [Candidatus Eremiobacteraeota bacterium]